MKIVDDQIGQILDVITGPTGQALRDNTWIVRTADHGELGVTYGGPRQKAFMCHDRVVRVPLIWSNPADFPRNFTTSVPPPSAAPTPTTPSTSHLNSPNCRSGPRLLRSSRPRQRRPNRQAHPDGKRTPRHRLRLATPHHRPPVTTDQNQSAGGIGTSGPEDPRRGIGMVAVWV